MKSAWAALVLLVLPLAAQADGGGVGSSTVAAPAVPLQGQKPPALAIPVVERPPVIDGKLDDPCWQTAAHVSGFYRYRNGEPIKEQTEMWICQDAKHLYFAFHCLDSHPELIKDHETQREGDLSHDDMVQILLDTQGNRHNVSQFTINARGTQQTQLEGGSADNIGWAGDWTAATQRTSDGWTCEVSIPYGLLHYPKGAKAFGFLVARQLARETNPEVWPFVPTGMDNQVMTYIADLTGLTPPTFAPRVVALPYVIGTTSNTNSLREGIDLKYPITPSISALATLFPDFQTVEGAVQDLSFSYTQKFLQDRRPFFAEGSQYSQNSFLFYSNQITNVDEGLKIVGKEGPTTINSLITHSAGETGQTAFMTSASEDLGRYSQVTATVLGNSAPGQPSNHVFNVGGNWGSAKGNRQYSLYANTSRSFDGLAGRDQGDYVQLSSQGGQSMWNGNVFFSDTGPNFANQLGLVTETDLRGEGFNVFRFDNYEKGSLENDFINLSGSTYRHITGGFFHDDLSVNTQWNKRNGTGYEIDFDAGKYWPYVDHTVTLGYSWGQKTLLRQGGLSWTGGRKQDQPYSYLSAHQGFVISKPFSIQATLGWVNLGGVPSTQTVVSATYRLNSNETIGGRLVQQDGDVNVYLSYGKRSRRGADVFFILGDPNATRTQVSAALKFVIPL